MICPNCGADIPEGSTSCPTCGYEAGATQTYEGGTQYGETAAASAQYAGSDAQYSDANAQYANSNMQYTDPNAPYADPTQAAYGSPYGTAQPKKKTGMIIGIIAGVVVVAAVVVCLVLFVFGNKRDGKYVCDIYSAFGIDVYLDVNGEDVKMVMEYDTDGDGEITEDEQESQEGTIEFDGDTCTITIDGSSEECTYDKKEGTITISDEDYGMELVFTKED
jgi:hypothetical protein